MSREHVFFGWLPDGRDCFVRSAPEMAIDEMAKEFGYIDYADMAQELKFDGEENCLNSTLVYDTNLKRHIRCCPEQRLIRHEEYAHLLEPSLEGVKTYAYDFYQHKTGKVPETLHDAYTLISNLEDHNEFFLYSFGVEVGNKFVKDGITYKLIHNEELENMTKERMTNQAEDDFAHSVFSRYVRYHCVVNEAFEHLRKQFEPETECNFWDAFYVVRV